MGNKIERKIELKKFVTIFYLGWITVTLALSLTIILKFYPNYDGEFILFTDFSTIIFVPSFCILVIVCIQIANTIIKNLKLKIFIFTLTLIITFIYLAKIVEYNIVFKIINFLLSLTFGFLYFVITEFIYRKSSLFKK